MAKFERLAAKYGDACATLVTTESLRCPLPGCVQLTSQAAIEKCNNFRSIKIRRVNINKFPRCILDHSTCLCWEHYRLVTSKSGWGRNKQTFSRLGVTRLLKNWHNNFVDWFCASNCWTKNMLWLRPISSSLSNVRTWTDFDIGFDTIDTGVKNHDKMVFGVTLADEGWMKDVTMTSVKRGGGRYLQILWLTVLSHYVT